MTVFPNQVTFEVGTSVNLLGEVEFNYKAREVSQVAI
jgi:hypothetical protein